MQCIRLMPFGLELSASLRLATCLRPGLTDGALAALTLQDVDIRCQDLCLLHVHTFTSHTLSNLRAESVGGMANFDIMAADRFLGRLSHAGRMKCTVTNNNIIMVVHCPTFSLRVLCWESHKIGGWLLGQ